MFLQKSDQLKKTCESLNIANYEYLPLIFLGRSIDSRKRLHEMLSAEEKKSLENIDHLTDFSNFL